MWQWIQGNLGIIIIALSFGVSGLGWLMQQLKQAQEKKKADQLRQKARLEALRTGRIEGQSGAGAPAAAPAGAQQTPKQRLEELARRRAQEQRSRNVDQRLELEEQLRRRREAIDAQRQRQMEQRQQQRQKQQGRAQQAQQRPGGSRPAQQASRGRGRAPQAPEVRPAGPAERRRVAAPAPEVPVQQTAIGDVIGSQRRQEGRPLEAPIAIGGASGRGGSLAGGLAAGLDLRQAVIMREILEKPVGIRGPMSEDF